MSTDTTELRIVRATGMAIDLSGPSEQLAQDADAITDAVRELRETKQAIVNVLAHRADKANRRTIEAGKFKFTVNAPTKPEVDVDRLHAKLWELSSEGLLDEEVIDQVIVTDVVRSIPAAQLALLRRHAEPAVAEAVEACVEMVEQSRTVKLARVSS